LYYLMNITKDVICNYRYSTNAQKIPCYNNIILDYGNEPGMVGQIALERSSGTFYGHNGITWVPLGGGGGPSIWVVSNSDDFIQDITQTNVGFGQNNLVFGSPTVDNSAFNTKMLFITKAGPGQGAFRAGKAETIQWDITNLGINSVAFGLNAIASGENSVIGSGNSNSIDSTSESSGILAGGAYNVNNENIINNSQVSFIGSGSDNIIGNNSPSSACGIVTGLINEIRPDLTFMVGASIVDNSVILCGNNNKIKDSDSVILAGNNLLLIKNETSLTQRFQTTQRVQHGLQVVTGDITLDNTHHYVYVDPGFDNITITLPSVNADVEGQELYIVTRALNTTVLCSPGNLMTSGLGTIASRVLTTAPSPAPPDPPNIFKIHLIAIVGVSGPSSGWITVSKTIV
jgi:hypothetical protein